MKTRVYNSPVNKFKAADLKRFVHESNAIEDVFNKKADEDGINAIVTAISIIGNGRVTPDKILEIHKIILQTVDPDIAGTFRIYDVRVGWRICPSYRAVSMLLKTLCKRPVPKTAEDIKKWHIEYERIHPHPDGNGRTGRAIMCAQRIIAGLPIEVIKASERDLYYEWFNEA